MKLHPTLSPLTRAVGAALAVHGGRALAARIGVEPAQLFANPLTLGDSCPGNNVSRFASL